MRLAAVSIVRCGFRCHFPSFISHGKRRKQSVCGNRSLKKCTCRQKNTATPFFGKQNCRIAFGKAGSAKTKRDISKKNNNMFNCSSMTLFQLPSPSWHALGSLLLTMVVVYGALWFKAVTARRGGDRVETRAQVRREGWRGADHGARSGALVHRAASGALRI